MAKKLLVADDSLTIQKVIRLALSGSAASGGESYDIQAVSDGNDAIQQISLFRPDIVLIDVSLPGKSAFEVKRAINEHRDLEEIRFVLMSSAFEKVDEKQVSEVAFHGRLTKPFDPAHLREILSQVLAQVHEKHREPTVLIRKPQSPPPPPSQEPQLGMPGLPPALPEEPSIPPFMPDFGGDQPPPPPPSSGLYPSFPEMPSFQGSESSTPPELPPEIPLSSVEEFPPEGRETFNDDYGTPPAPPPPPQSSRAAEAPDSDIRNLTESTIRMAGLDDFQWSVQEPSLKPPASMYAQGDPTLPPGRQPKTEGTRGEFSFQPPREFPEIPDLDSQLSDLPLESSLPPSAQPSQPSQAKREAPTGMPLMPDLDLSAPSSQAIELSTEPPPDEFEHYPEPESPAPGLAPQISMDQIEEIVRREVEKVFKDIVRRAVPDMAERLVREELRKLLNEQPGS